MRFGHLNICLFNIILVSFFFVFFFQAEDGIRDRNVTGVQTCAIPIYTMILRKATFSELPVIWDILQQAIEQRKQDGSDQWQNGYPNRETVHDDITNGYAYVLVEDKIGRASCRYSL